MKKYIALLSAAAVCLSLASCSQDTQAESQLPETSASQTAGEAPAVTSQTADEVKASVAVTIAQEDEMFSERDLRSDYSEAETIDLRTVTDPQITITAAGTYRLTGTFSGQIVVDAGDSDKVQLVLDNAAITCAGSAALYVKNADKVFVTTAAGSTNTLSSAGEFTQTDDSRIDAAVFSKDDITFNGEGTLVISCETSHGIAGKDDIRITGGTYTINAAKKGIDCEGSVRIADGTITVGAGTDAIQCENDENDTEKSFVYISGGSLKLDSGNDCIDCAGAVTVLNASLELTSGGGSANGAAHTENFGFIRSDSTQTTAETESSDSYKGIKSGTVLTLSGAVINSDTADDALHSNGTVYITDGTSLTASSGDDGIHADTAVYITGGTVDITKSYEGIEGKVIDISGGQISVTASDDGLNAGGGADASAAGNFGRGGMMDTDADAKLNISGGTININASGDGLDSNGYLTVSGGYTTVSGPTNSGNGALDYGISGTVTGGTVIAAGYSGMAENFGSESAQGSILYTFTSAVTGGTEITLTDSTGKTIASFAPEKDYECVLISTPEIAAGNTYRIAAGSENGEIEMTSLIYGGGNAFGGFGERENQNGGFPQMQGAQDGSFPQMPDGQDGERLTPPDFQNGGGHIRGQKGFGQSPGQSLGQSPEQSSEQSSEQSPEQIMAQTSGADSVQM